MAEERCLEQWAVVTGASKGLGAAICRALATGTSVGQPLRGVIVVARNGGLLRKLQEELGQLAAQAGCQPLGVRIVEADLSDSEKSTAAVLEAAQGVEVSVLVNCAGLAASCRDFDVTPEVSLKQELAVNVEAPMVLTRALLPGMIERGRGRVLNIASIASFLPAPYMSTYGASKAWLYSWSMAMTRELRSTAVTVTCFCPGHFHSDFDGAVGGGSGDRLIARLPGLTERNVHRVATAALKCLRKRRRWGTNGWINWFNVMTIGLLPSWLVLAMTARLQWVQGCRR